MRHHGRQYEAGVCHDVSVLGRREPGSTPQTHPKSGALPQDAGGRFLSHLLADTEDTRTTLFKRPGKTYQVAKLVLPSGQTSSACGIGHAAMGPFCCSPDQEVHIDLSFHQDLQSRFRAPGDFNQAHVMAGVESAPTYCAILV